MKCLETEKLIGYAYRLSDEPAASQVRTHLAECSRCRAMVEQHGRLDAALDAWRVAEPSPAFDARVREAVEVQKVRREASWFGGWQWVRSMALASLGLLIVAGLTMFRQGRTGEFHSRQVATGQGEFIGPQSSAQNSDFHSPVGSERTGNGSTEGVSAGRFAGVGATEDQDAQALEDYDLAANFDLLSELPRAQQRVAN